MLLEYLSSSDIDTVNLGITLLKSEVSDKRAIGLINSFINKYLFYFDEESFKVYYYSTTFTTTSSINTSLNVSGNLIFTNGSGVSFFQGSGSSTGITYK